MPQYAVMIFESAPADQWPPEVNEAHMALAGRIAGELARLSLVASR